LRRIKNKQCITETRILDNQLTRFVVVSYSFLPRDAMLTRYNAIIVHDQQRRLVHIYSLR